MKHSKIRHSLLAAALTALIAPAPAVFAQSAGEAEPKSATEDPSRSSAWNRGRDRSDAREKANARSKSGSKSESTAPAAQYPNATRQPPAVKASAKIGPKLQKIFNFLDESKSAEARKLADEIMADPKANEYERALAAQVAAQAALEVDDTAAAKRYMQQAVEANGLDNNNHYNALLTLAQLQLQDDEFEPALATFDRFFNETKSQKPEHLVLKGNALYRLERYPEAVTVLKQAIDASPEPRAEWLQLLMGAYLENNQSAEAVKVAESVAAKTPNDKRAQMNLAAVYLQNEMFDQGAAVYEKLRAAGQLTEERDYRNLYVAYYNMEGKQNKVVEVINDGLQKGVLKPDHQTYLALAQAHYDLEQTGPAIEAYKKAAPLAETGETYLNLARMLWQENRIADAKDAAKQAIAKGLKKPDDAKKILALPAK
ncbi:tetratricopeptide repeat protein [Lysobacter korlensis]|uniref:Tetratricopeptide repeat protein n=1 Tax=Lysobacter korlensis TaxID=553636 RepID=A0ABV6RKG3_9GAMM